MKTIQQKLQKLIADKEELRQGFNSRGANIGDFEPLSNYDDQLDNLIYEPSKLEADLIAAHNSKVGTQNITLFGYQGNETYIGADSVNHYLAADMPTINDTAYRVSSSANNYGYAFGSNGRSVEFICVHDTEDTASDAAATGA